MIKLNYIDNRGGLAQGAINQVAPQTFRINNTDPIITIFGPFLKFNCYCNIELFLEFSKFKKNVRAPN